MHAVFHEMDKDCNGSIELHEFQRAMAKLEAPLDDNEARAVFEHIDSHGNCDGRVEYKELLAALKQRRDAEDDKTCSMGLSLEGMDRMCTIRVTADSGNASISKNLYASDCLLCVCIETLIKFCHR